MEYIVFILFMGIMSFIEVFYFKKKIFFILVIILYILFFGNRGIIGFDLGHYYPNFYKIPNIFEMISSMRFKYCEYDIGFQIYIGILKVFISNFNICNNNNRWDFNVFGFSEFFFISSNISFYIYWVKWNDNANKFIEKY